jgi:molecular chaperone DnaK (HSP70)
LLAIPGKKENSLVVVAIDFGTTLSGYAYSLWEEYIKDQDKINMITWQSGDGLQTNKTPTTIPFDKDEKFHSFGYDAERDYAVMLEDGTHEEYRYFSKFKMILYQHECGVKEGNMKGKVSKFSYLIVTITSFNDLSPGV